MGKRFFLQMFACVLTLAVFLPGAARAACSLPNAPAGQIVYNSTAKVMQYCDDNDWIAMNQPGGVVAPLNCPAVGDLCSDGTYYAGLSPDGGVPIYVAAANLNGGTGYAWGANDIVTGAVDGDSGYNNTQHLVTNYL